MRASVAMGKFLSVGVLVASVIAARINEIWVGLRRDLCGAA